VTGSENKISDKCDDINYVSEIEISLNLCFSRMKGYPGTYLV
jgi:hypothetical protein